MQGRWLLDPALAPQLPWIGKLSFVFSLTAVIGFGAAALPLPNLVRNPAGGIAAAEPPLNLYPSEPPTQPARLVVQSQHGFVNEAVSLGISLADASGGRILEGRHHGQRHHHAPRRLPNLHKKGKHHLTLPTFC
jgi:hypothetical protein